jgi:predicted negative regulator of RcsB-dependent stress response
MSATHRAALQLEQAIGDRYNYSGTLIRFGDVHRDNGDRDAARSAWRQALVVLNELHHPDAEEVHVKLSGLDSPGWQPPAGA